MRRSLVGAGFSLFVLASAFLNGNASGLVFQETTSSTATAAFTQVLADYEAFRRNVSPEYAMSQGDDTRAGELADVSPRGHITVLNGTREYLERVVGIDVAALSVADHKK